AGASLLQDWGERATTVADFLAIFRPSLQVRLEELHDAFGPALWPEMGALVVSAETEAGGAAVNDRRREKSVPQLEVVAVPLVAAAGGKVSSTTAREMDSLASALAGCWAMVPEQGRASRWLPLLLALARQAAQEDRQLPQKIKGLADASKSSESKWALAAARCLEMAKLPGLLEAVAEDAGWAETAVKLIRCELGVGDRSRL
ncbi:COAD, partial [Symbiodinium pilosum]